MRYESIYFERRMMMHKQIKSNAFRGWCVVTSTPQYGHEIMGINVIMELCLLCMCIYKQLTI